VKVVRPVPGSENERQFKRWDAPMAFRLEVDGIAFRDVALLRL